MRFMLNDGGGLRCRRTKLIYTNHRLPPWVNEDATRDRSIVRWYRYGANPRVDHAVNASAIGPANIRPTAETAREKIPSSGALRKKNMLTTAAANPAQNTATMSNGGPIRK
jgi:hypothetical protein